MTRRRRDGALAGRSFLRSAVVILALIGAGWLLGAQVRDEPLAEAGSEPTGTARRRTHTAAAPDGRDHGAITTQVLDAGTRLAAEGWNPARQPGIALAARLHPRPASEWQGMRVDMTYRQVCDGSSTCGLALACLEDGHCGPCDDDAQCSAGETCVLDHCLSLQNVGCRRASDCGGDGRRCMLSGYTPMGRGNGDMRAYCGEPRGPRRAPAGTRSRREEG